jgi:hypothetical protein
MKLCSITSAKQPPPLPYPRSSLRLDLWMYGNQTDPVIPKYFEAFYVVKSAFHVRNNWHLKTNHFVHFRSIITYGLIIWDILLRVTRYSVYKRKLLQLWYVQSLETHTDTCSRNYNFASPMQLPISSMNVTVNTTQNICSKFSCM